jgi:tRNA(adenine34) deaminase
MCAGAIVLARIPTLVFGSYDSKAGACGTLYDIVEDRRLNHTVHVVGGICDKESEILLKRFFAKKRVQGVLNKGILNNSQFSKLK